MAIKFFTQALHITALLCCLAQLHAADLFGEDLAEEDNKNAVEEKVWSREEISDFKKETKTTYKALLKANDYWSALQLEHWVKKHGPDIKFSTALNRAVSGNPLHAFPQTIRHYFEHNDWIAVVADDFIHYINEEGRPLFPSTKAPFYSGQTAITADRRFVAGMQTSIRGQAPALTYFYRLYIYDNEEEEFTLRTSWIQSLDPIDNHYDHHTSISHSGNSVAFRLRGADRRRDFVVVAHGDKKVRSNHDNFRSVIGIGENGDWLLGRLAQNNRLQLIRDGKRSAIYRMCSKNGYGAYVAENKKDLFVLHPDNEQVQLPLTCNPGSRLWATDRYLIVNLGNVTQKQADEKDVFGTVIKKGEETQVQKTYIYKWQDLRSKDAKPIKEIDGRCRMNQQRNDCLLHIQDNTITLINCVHDEIKETPFSSLPENIRKINIHHNGIRVQSESYKNYMLNYHGDIIWQGGTGYAEMIHPMVMLYEEEYKEKKRTFYKYELVQFFPDKEPLRFTLPNPKNGIPYDVAVDYHMRFGTLYSSDQRMWLHFNLINGQTILDGHVKADQDPIPRWRWKNWTGFNGRFNAFNGRLIPKWDYQQRPAADDFYPRDAMYTRGGLMVITEDDKLHKFNKDLEHTEHMNDIQLRYGLFAIADKDINTYITGWMTDAHKAQYLVDKSGKIKTIAKPAAIDPQRPEGEWQCNGRNLYLPRHGSKYWPSSAVGFSPRRLRSRDGARNLLVITSSLLLELDSTTIKKLFPR